MIDKCSLKKDSQILDALKALGTSGEGVALVVDEASKLLGIVTDGDVRRALLKGAQLSDPIGAYMTKDFSSVSPSQDRASVLDLMQARQFRHVPIVDGDGYLKGVHLMREIIGHEEKANWAVIMAGGKGTRLYPLTKDIPKPMITVAGRPILERLVLHLVSHGIRKVFLSVNYLSEVIEDYFGDGSRFGCHIEYLRETEPLGTAGSISLLPEIPTQPLFVMNGDLVMNTNISEMLAYHQNGDYFCTMGVKPYTHQIPYGCISVEGDRMVSIDEKPDVIRLVNAGVYLLSPAALAMIPKKFYPITDLFDDALGQNKPVGAFNIDEEWVDVGQHEQLKQARGEI